MSKKKFQIIAYHGWGFDPSIWEPLKTELDPYVKFECADRGYYSDSFEPSWIDYPESDTEKFLFVHSYGLHWCHRKILEEADQLVLIGSFLNFHPGEKKEYKRSKLVLRKMLTQFVDAPKTVLEKFYENAFFPNKTGLDVPGNLNHDLLLSDLSDLDRDNRENARLFDMSDITIIHGAEDQIVNNELARDMYKKLRLRSQYFEIKKGGHALQFTHSSKIFEILNSLFQFK